MGEERSRVENDRGKGRVDRVCETIGSFTTMALAWIEDQLFQIGNLREIHFKEKPRLEE